MLSDPNSPTITVKDIRFLSVSLNLPFLRVPHLWFIIRIEPGIFFEKDFMVTTLRNIPIRYLPGMPI